MLLRSFLASCMEETPDEVRIHFPSDAFISFITMQRLSADMLVVPGLDSQGKQHPQVFRILCTIPIAADFRNHGPSTTKTRMTLKTVNLSLTAQQSIQSQRLLCHAP